MRTAHGRRQLNALFRVISGLYPIAICTLASFKGYYITAPLREMNEIIAFLQKRLISSTMVSKLRNHLF